MLAVSCNLSELCEICRVSRGVSCAHTVIGGMRCGLFILVEM